MQDVGLVSAAGAMVLLPFTFLKFCTEVHVE